MPNFGAQPRFGELALQGFLDGRQAQQQAVQFTAQHALQEAQLRTAAEQFATQQRVEQERLGIERERVDISRADAESAQAFRAAQTANLDERTLGLINQNSLFATAANQPLASDFSNLTREQILAFPELAKARLDAQTQLQAANIGVGPAFSRVAQQERFFNDPISRADRVFGVHRTAAQGEELRARAETGQGILGLLTQEQLDKLVNKFIEDLDKEE